MTSHDLPAFTDMFHELASMFRLYGSDEQKAATLSAYFQTFQHYPLERVRMGYEALKTTATKWPVPAQWIAAMPRQDASLPELDWRQIKAADEAERLFYEGWCCGCEVCVAANVTHLPTRYVPMLNVDGDVIPMRHPGRSRPVYLGEWLHGARLRAWWTARAEFHEALNRTKPKRMETA